MDFQNDNNDSTDNFSDVNYTSLNQVPDPNVLSTKNPSNYQNSSDTSKKNNKNLYKKVRNKSERSNADPSGSFGFGYGTTFHSSVDNNNSHIDNRYNFSNRSNVENENYGNYVSSSKGDKRERTFSEEIAEAQKALGRVGTNIKSGVSKAFVSTSNWVKNQTNSFAKSFGNDHTVQSIEEGDELRDRTTNVSFVKAKEIQDFEEIGEIDEVYDAFVASIPFGLFEGDGFIVALPNGENRYVEYLKDYTEIIVPFINFNIDNPTQDKTLRNINDKSSADEEKPQQERIEEKSAKIVDLYRIFRPQEIEAVLFRNNRGDYGITVFDGEFGVHVYSCVFTGLKNMITFDDIILMVNGIPVKNKDHFEKLIETKKAKQQAAGEPVTLTLLRKSLSVAQKCPQNEELLPFSLKELTTRNKGNHAAEVNCRSCNRSLFEKQGEDSVEQFDFYQSWNWRWCPNCFWLICPSCKRTITEKLKSEINANHPKWEHDLEEDPMARLKMTLEDVGLYIRIYWSTTKEWWLGEIRNFDPNKGHTIVYEIEPDKFSQEIVTDINATREYRILKKVIVNLEQQGNDSYENLKYDPPGEEQELPMI